MFEIWFNALRDVCKTLGLKVSNDYMYGSTGLAYSIRAGRSSATACILQAISRLVVELLIRLSNAPKSIENVRHDSRVATRCCPF